MDGRKIDPPLTLYRVALDQASVASSFLASPALRPAIITIWVASFGAALHMPCTTYYYRVVGASDVDIGAINMVATVGSLVLGPVYGHVLDTRGPFVPVVVSCAFCALGCALRGAANSVAMLYFAAFVLGIGGSNLWTTVLGLVVKRSPRANRSVAVSGYLVQVALLRLGGKLLYNPLDWALSAFTHWTVVRRYRAIMSICTIFCFFGVFELVRSRAAIALDPEPSSAGAAASAASMDADAAAEARSMADRWTRDRSSKMSVDLDLKTKKNVAGIPSAARKKVGKPTGSSEARPGSERARCSRAVASRRARQEQLTL